LAPLLQEAAPMVAYFLLDFSTSNLSSVLLGEQAEGWKNLFARYPVLLDVNLPAETLPQLLSTLRPAGFALRGGSEERVGIKSFEEVDDVFEHINPSNG
jgi:phosphoribosylanthranilate isomerase